jgi:hypothetical protein
VHGIPAMFVIDKEGKIVFKGMSGEELKTAIQGAL